MKEILLVDDEDDIIWLTKKILEKEGFKVRAVKNGEKALELLREGYKPDLILLDVMMPGLSGWEICKKIKEDEKLKKIKVAIFTIRTTDEDKFISKEVGADYHIDKPFDLDEFVSTVKKLVHTATPVV